jgi:hypothetical protein
VDGERTIAAKTRPRKRSATAEMHTAAEVAPTTAEMPAAEVPAAMAAAVKVPATSVAASTMAAAVTAAMTAAAFCSGIARD